MTPATLKALRGSIRKWKLIEEGKGVDRGTENCPLCKRFWKNDCRGCPVADAAGDTNCGGTPYRLWCHLHGYEPFGKTATTPMQRRMARKFRVWLEAILPKKARKE